MTDIYVHASRCTIVRVYEHYAWIVELYNDAFATDFVKKRVMYSARGNNLEESLS